MSFWDKLNDAMPWNRRKVAEREELERQIQEMADDDVAPAGSAAEAMEAMKSASKARRKPTEAEPQAEDLSVGGVPRKQASGADEAEKDRIRRNRGG